MPISLAYVCGLRPFFLFFFIYLLFLSRLRVFIRLNYLTGRARAAAPDKNSIFFSSYKKAAERALPIPRSERYPRSRERDATRATRIYANRLGGIHTRPDAFPTLSIVGDPPELSIIHYTAVRRLLKILLHRLRSAYHANNAKKLIQSVFFFSF